MSDDDDDDVEENFLDPSYWSSFYDEDDEQFDWYSAPGLAYAAALREIDGPHSFVLDVGCGTASHLSALSRRSNVIGIDFSQRVVELASEFDETKRVSFACADARRLPFASSSFDVVLDKGCLDCFVSTPDASSHQRDSYLREIHRVLKPDGVYVLCAVCGVDVVSLFHSGLAVKHTEATFGTRRPPETEWEIARTGRDNGLFSVSQIVSFRNKHLFRVVKRGAPRTNIITRSKTTRIENGEDFDDLPTDALGLDDGLFCGSCGHRVLDTVAAEQDDGVHVPEFCDECSAPLRRFALS